MCLGATEKKVLMTHTVGLVNFVCRSEVRDEGGWVREKRLKDWHNVDRYSVDVNQRCGRVRRGRFTVALADLLFRGHLVHDPCAFSF